MHYFLSRSLLVIYGEGNGNPLQCTCLEHPRAGGAWWAAVFGVAQSRTRLRQISSSSGWFSILLHPLVKKRGEEMSASKWTRPQRSDDMLGYYLLRLGRSPGGGKGYPLQYSGLENSRDYTVHGVTKSWTYWATFTTTNRTKINKTVKWMYVSKICFRPKMQLSKHFIIRKHPSSLITHAHFCPNLKK